MSTERIVEFNKAAIAESQPGEVTIVDFWAPWCGPCRMMEPVIHALVEEDPSLTIMKVNIDEEPDIVSEYGISSVPTFVIYQGGKEMERTSGARSRADMRALIAKYKN